MMAVIKVEKLSEAQSIILAQLMEEVITQCEKITKIYSLGIEIQKECLIYSEQLEEEDENENQYNSNFAEKVIVKAKRTNRFIV